MSLVETGRIGPPLRESSWIYVAIAPSLLSLCFLKLTSFAIRGNKGQGAGVHAGVCSHARKAISSWSTVMAHARRPMTCVLLTLVCSISGASPRLTVFSNSTLNLDNNGLPIMLNSADLNAFIQQTDAHIAALEATVSLQASRLERLGSVIDIYSPGLVGPSVSQVARLTASDAASRDRFGKAVAVADLGSKLAIIAVGAYGQDETGAGKAYLIRANLTKGSQTFTTPKLVLPTDLSSNSNYGSSIALAPDGRTVVVGAPTADKVS